MDSRLTKLEELARELGLTDKEAEVYAAIYVMESATVKDLLDALQSIHQPQLYNILNNLQRKGFVRVSMGRPKRYTAVSLEALLEARKARLDRLLGEALRAAEEVKRLKGEMGEEEAYVYMVKGYTGVTASLVEIFTSAEAEVCAELPLSVAKEVLGVIEATLRRGINVYLLVFPRADRELVSRLSGYGNLKLKEHMLGSFLLAEADIGRAIYSRRRFYSTRKLPVPDSEVYGFYIAERDLIWRLLTIWESLWHESKTLVTWPLEPSSYPKRFLEFGLSVYEVEQLLGAGYRPYVYVRGAYVRSREPVELEGHVVAVRRSPHIWNFTVVVEGEEITVGGNDAEIEDVEAEEVVIREIVRA